MPTLRIKKKEKWVLAACWQGTTAVKQLGRPKLSHVFSVVRLRVDHPREQSQSRLSLGSSLVPFYLNDPLIISLCFAALDTVTLHYASMCPSVCVCVWCLHSSKHTLWTDTDRLLRNSSSRLRLQWGGEGKSGKINRTSLQFMLSLFQNKPSDGGEDCRGFLKGF